MGEKGNVTSDELVAGAGAVIAPSGTQVTAVFEEAGETLKAKVMDKGADATIEEAQERWRRHRGDGPDDREPPQDKV